MLHSPGLYPEDETTPDLETNSAVWWLPFSSKQFSSILFHSIQFSGSIFLGGYGPRSVCRTQRGRPRKVELRPALLVSVLLPAALAPGSLLYMDHVTLLPCPVALGWFRQWKTPTEMGVGGHKSLGYLSPDTPLELRACVHFASAQPSFSVQPYL